MDVGFFLKASPLLKGFTDDGVKIIQAATTPRQLSPGAPLFVEQMPGDSLFIIAEGAVELYLTRDGKERSLAVLRAPEHFGEISLLRPGPRRVSARAQVAAALLEITRRDFQTLQRQRPQACLKLMLNIVERFGERAGEAAPVIGRLLFPGS